MLQGDLTLLLHTHQVAVGLASLFTAYMRCMQVLPLFLRTHGQQCNVTYKQPHTFCLTLFYLILPDHFVQRSIKLLVLLFFSKTNGVCKPLQVILH